MQPLDVAAELFHPVDLAAALDLDGHHLARPVSRQTRSIGPIAVGYSRRTRVRPSSIACGDAASSSCRWASTPSFCRPGSSPNSWAVSVSTSSRVMVSFSPLGLVTTQASSP